MLKVELEVGKHLAIGVVRGYRFNFLYTGAMHYILQLGGMKNLLLLGGLLAASFTACGQVMPTKQQSVAQRDSVVTDSLWGPGAYHSHHYKRIFEIPPGVRAILPRRTKKGSIP
jgi:hypothetical protein